MPLQSRWTIPIPKCHLATLLFTSPTHPLSPTHRCFLDAARPDTHYFTDHTFRLWSQRFAAGLRAAGLQPGDRVLLFSGNDLFFPVIFMGTIMAGGIFTGANPAFVARELEYQLRDSGATFLICARDSLGAGLEAAKGAGLEWERMFVFDSAVFDLELRGGGDVEEEGKGKGKGKGIGDLMGKGLPEEAVNPGYRYWGELIASVEEGSRFVWDDLTRPGAAATQTLTLNYSSGTTGRPKGVEITHQNYVANLLQYNFLFYLYPDWVERGARARWLCFLPMYHALAQNIFIAAALRRGVPVYIMPKFDMLKMLEYTERFRITDLILVPPVVVALAKHPAVRSGKFDLSSVEGVASGAAPLGAEICEQVEKLWEPGRIHVRQGWGMTETTCSLLGWDPRIKPDPTSVGELNANCEAKIMAEDDRTELGPNQRGELWVRGQNIMKRYWKNPGATKEAKTDDGWLKTGDIAFVDDQGLFHVVDRKKELIKVKGNQVAPAELEAILLDHPAVADAAVIGVPMFDDERPRAYIVLNSGQVTTERDILSFMDGKVSSFKRITGGIIFIDAIPKNPSGKILRKMLRERASREMQPAARL